MDLQLNDWPLVKVVDRSDNNYFKGFNLFLVHLTPKIRRLNPKSLDFSQLKPRNIFKTYLSQIIIQNIKI